MSTISAAKHGETVAMIETEQPLPRVTRRQRGAAAFSPTEQSRGRAMAAPFAQSATTNVWVSGWD